MIDLTPKRVLDEDVVARLWITVEGALAYLVSEGSDTDTVLVVPCNDVVVEALETNLLPLRDALTDPNMLLVNQSHDGTQDVRLVTETDVPHLPNPGVFLHP